MKKHKSTSFARYNWPSPMAALTAVIAAVLLTACGGGGDIASGTTGTTVGTGSSQPETPVTPASVSLPQALFELNYPQVVNTNYLSVTADTASKASAAAASPTPVITPAELLDWAEAMFPARFPAGAQNQTSDNLTYRYYPATQRYLGVANNVVYAFGTDTANRVVNAGNLGDFNCSVKPGSCTVIPVQAFTCDVGAITCVEVTSTAGVNQSSVPVTFGQPFKAGAWKHLTTGLIARDNLKQTVPLQADDISSHRDGSARFAVLHANLSNLAAGERRIINLFPGSPNTAPQSLPADPAWNMEVQAKIYSPQVTRVRFGNRNGSTAGTPFLVGETIQLQLVGPRVETYSLTVDATQAGGAHDTLTKIAEAFMAKINAGSTVFIAEKPGTSYENLYIRPRDLNQGAFSVSVSYGGMATITQANESTYVAPDTWVFNAQNSLKTAIALATGKQADPARRFHGPVASEFHLASPLKNATTGAEHPFLTARLDTRLYGNGSKIRTDVVLENNWTFKANPRNITYELTVKQNGQTAFHQPAFDHYHHARWHKVVWTQQPAVLVRHQMRDFLDSRAVWNYDLSLVIPESVLANEASQLASKRAAQSALGPMANVFLQPNFGSTGGRWDIGPLPRWTALYLVTQDQRAYESMMANADAAGAVPVHYRNENTDLPINTIDNPNLTVYTYSANVPKSADPTIWSPDTAHQASFTYVPYLLTGDRFYLDEAMFWASWNVFMLPSDYRYKEQSLINRQQIRGQAWALRSIGEAYRILPDAHPMKAYFTTLLDSNLNWYRDYYVTQMLGSPMGAIQFNATETPPWQNDFVATVFAQLAENNDPGAAETLNWFSRFTVGRFLADADGFCSAKAPGYYWTNANAGGGYFTSWAQLFSANYANDVGKACNTLTITEGYPSSPGGYVAYARGMLGAVANTGHADALTAYSKWKAMTPKIESAFTGDPTWAIVPRW